MSEDDSVVETDQCCKVCGKDDDDANMVLCDLCDLGYHIYCHTPKLTMADIPEGDLPWYCAACTKMQSRLTEVVWARVNAKKDDWWPCFIYNPQELPEYLQDKAFKNIALNKFSIYYYSANNYGFVPNNSLNLKSWQEGVDENLMTAKLLTKNKKEQQQWKEAVELAATEFLLPGDQRVKWNHEDAMSEEDEKEAAGSDDDEDDESEEELEVVDDSKKRGRPASGKSARKSEKRAKDSAGSVVKKKGADSAKYPLLTGFLTSLKAVLSEEPINTTRAVALVQKVGRNPPARTDIQTDSVCKELISILKTSMKHENEKIKEAGVAWKEAWRAHWGTKSAGSSSSATTGTSTDTSSATRPSISQVANAMTSKSKGSTIGINLVKKSSSDNAFGMKERPRADAADLKSQPAVSRLNLSNPTTSIAPQVTQVKKPPATVSITKRFLTQKVAAPPAPAPKVTTTPGHASTSGGQGSSSNGGMPRSGSGSRLQSLSGGRPAEIIIPKEETPNEGKIDAAGIRHVMREGVVRMVWFVLRNTDAAIKIEQKACEIYGKDRSNEYVHKCRKIAYFLPKDMLLRIIEPKSDPLDLGTLFTMDFSQINQNNSRM